jgi:hypothetical protein
MFADCRQAIPSRMPLEDFWTDFSNWCLGHSWALPTGEVAELLARVHELLLAAADNDKSLTRPPRADAEPTALETFIVRAKSMSILDLGEMLTPPAGKHVSIEEMNPWQNSEGKK